jgi:hypothetical protein
VVFLKILALTAVNLNAKYLSCVPYFIEFWLSLKSTIPAVTYVPKVLVMADKLPGSLQKYSQWCELFDLKQTVSSTFGSQAVRILQPSLEKVDLVLTTDVDMLPMSDRILKKAIEAINLGAEFIVCRDVLSRGQYPICYNLASPDVWARVNGAHSQNDVKNSLQDWFDGLGVGNAYSGNHGGVGWFSDQEKLFEMVQDFQKRGGAVTKLKDRDTGHRRLDRLFMPFPINWIFLPAVKNRYFTDYHVHHPVTRYKRYLSAVLRMRNGFNNKIGI